MDEATVQFYDKNAQAYIDRTSRADLSSILDRFLERIPSRGRVLDYGCGFGRDIDYFESHGLKVVGVDPSQEMARIARLSTNAKIIVGDVFSLGDEKFDGIWACASLLHVPQREIVAVLEALYRTLAPGGTFYASVRLGSLEHRHSDGRYFVDYQPDQFQLLLGALPWQSHELWLSPDADPQRRDLSWINWLGKKSE